VSESRRIVLDANILLRAVLGERVRKLLLDYQESVSFYSPQVCFEQARRNIPEIASRRGVDSVSILRLLDDLDLMIEVVDELDYVEHEATARSRIASRDITDWPIIATALLLDCPIWTEDRDFFGSGVATWTTRNVGLYLKG
jgi:predicted nucleic acid-binding protein